MRQKLALGLCAALAWSGLASAQQSDSTPDQQEVSRLKGILDSERPVTGDVRIAASNATFHLGDRYYFLDSGDAKKVVIDAWSNPPDTADGVLGMIFAKGKTFADSWGAVITYDPAGYVSDKDAKSADYNKLLVQEQQGEDDLNQQRKKSGFPSMHLVGWAQQPTYDPVSHSEVWARRIQFSGEGVDTLNYDTRILGRRGVLSVNIVSDMNHLDEARTAANELARTAEFDPGSRYGDFQDGDQKAAYGIAGLVAAGLGLAAAKHFGLLAIILLFAKKAFVLIAVAFAWIASKFRKLFGLPEPKRKSKSKPQPLQLDSEAAETPKADTDPA
jgi:uncharacterized membrane-anchored protein